MSAVQQIRETVTGGHGGSLPSSFSSRPFDPGNLAPHFKRSAESSANIAEGDLDPRAQSPVSPVDQLREPPVSDAPFTKNWRRLLQCLFFPTLALTVMLYIFVVAWGSLASKKSLARVYLRPERIAAIVAEETGVVSFDTVFPVGGRVEEGDRLGVVESSLLAEQIRVAEGEMEQVERQSIRAAARCCRTVSEVDERRRDLLQFAARREQLHKRLAGLRRAASHCVILAPCDGRIVNVASQAANVAKGQVVLRICPASSGLRMVIEGPIDVITDLIRDRRCQATFRTGTGDVTVTGTIPDELEIPCETFHVEKRNRDELWGRIYAVPSQELAPIVAIAYRHGVLQ